MNFDNEGAARKAGAGTAGKAHAEARTERTLTADEVKRQLGLNLIEAARHFDDVQVSLARYRR